MIRGNDNSHTKPIMSYIFVSDFNRSALPVSSGGNLPVFDSPPRVSKPASSGKFGFFMFLKRLVIRGHLRTGSGCEVQSSCAACTQVPFSSYHHSHSATQSFHWACTHRPTVFGATPLLMSACYPLCLLRLVINVGPNCLAAVFVAVSAMMPVSCQLVYWYLC